MSRKSRKEKKWQARMHKRQNRQQPMHILHENWIDASEYIEWWKNPNKEPKKNNGRQPFRTMAKHQQKPKEPRPIAYDDYMRLPWDWEMEWNPAGEGKKEKLNSKNKKEKMDMYVQGDGLFLLRNGYTQKLTAFHRVSIVDANKKKWPNNEPETIIDWVKDNEMTNRATAMGLEIKK